MQNENTDLINALESLYADSRRVEAIEAEIASLKAELEALCEEKRIEAVTENLKELLIPSIASGVTAFPLPTFEGIIAAVRPTEFTNLIAGLKSPVIFHSTK